MRSFENQQKYEFDSHIHDWFEVGCVVLPDGGGIGYVTTVKEVLPTKNKLPRRQDK